MIQSEPLEIVNTEHVTFPSDEGLQHRWLRCHITPADGVGFAGHLGVIEEACTTTFGDGPDDIGAHALLRPGAPCETCGAAV